jgi:acetyl/propionyl-CoA carboxylase alpha subunit
LKTFHKILIANRGEIVLRIADTAGKMGIPIAGIFAENDRESEWLKKIPEAYSLGEGAISETYLNIEKMIAIALRCGANAIHPGYGFLAENPSFAQACADHDITFIGPAPEVLRLTGDKLEARKVAVSLGIPVPESYTGSASDMLKKKNAFKYPVMVKAVYGGGGKGMRLVRAPEELEQAIHITSSEAILYFGDERIYLEQYIDHVRHIEVQILADMHGNIMHVFDRECSLQRRHQKIIEEAPSCLDPFVKELIYSAALAMGQHIGFTHAGTIEFLVNDQGAFSFLEINPRIQVEHGITEMITGVDIVKEQIQIAQGKVLSLMNSDIRAHGHSIEARIYAEDFESDFSPSPGRIHAFLPPQDAEIRLETAVGNYSEVSGSYDPMIAKILVHAPTRDEAILKITQTINDFVITGVRHNLALLKQIFMDNDFRHHHTSTQFIKQKKPIYLKSIAEIRQTLDPWHLVVAASVLVIMQNMEKESAWDQYWRNVQQIRFRLNHHIMEADYRYLGNAFEFYTDEKCFYVSEIVIEWHAIHFNINHTPMTLYYVPEKDGTIEFSNGHIQYLLERFFLPVPFMLSTETEANADHSLLIVAPQPGTVLDIKVTEGQKIKVGDNLITLESMKLENTILALQSGMIKKISIKKGDKVKKNEPLIYLQ